jgi:phage/plasmid-associated DNA primase
VAGHPRLEGCREWQQRGLDPPKAVVDATEAYFLDQDAVGAWLDECCDQDNNAWEGSTALYNSWKAYAERTGERTGTAKDFAQALETKKFVRRRRNKARGYHGLRLKPDDPDRLLAVEEPDLGDNPDPTPDNPDPTPDNPDPTADNPDPTADNPDPTAEAPELG